jgi:hypothetical protein
MVSSRAYPGLERKPGGPDNWVEAAGGLPDYIERIAKHLHYEKGMTISHAIATAVNTVKRWARGGKVAKYGDPHMKRVSPKTIAQAAAAVAAWEAKKRAGSLALSEGLVALIDLTEVGDDLVYDLLEFADADSTGASQPGHDILPPMNIEDLVLRANQIKDPAAKAKARQAVLDLAVPRSELTVEKRKQRAASGSAMPDGSFPIFDETSLHSAIRLAHTPAQRAHVIKRARSLGLSDALPDKWTTDLTEIAVCTGLVSILDLASTIPPRNARGRATDGRKSFKKQGKWKHGFIPVTGAASEAKAKGSPIAMKRMHRLFGEPGKDPKGAPNDFPNRSRAGQRPKRVLAAKGRVGERHAEARKTNPKEVKIDEKLHPGSERAKDVGFLQRTPFEDAENRNKVRSGKEGMLPNSQKEASKSSRIPERARQNWNEIPEALKTVRNGKRFVVAEFGGKQYVTEWVGGVDESTSSPLSKRKVMRTLASADAASMSASNLRDLVNNPQTPDSVRKVARKALRTQAAKATA